MQRTINRGVGFEIDDRAITKKSGVERDERIFLDVSVMRQMFLETLAAGFQQRGEIRHAQTSGLIVKIRKLRRKNAVDKNQLANRFLAEAELADVLPREIFVGASGFEWNFCDR